MPGLKRTTRPPEDSEDDSDRSGGPEKRGATTSKRQRLSTEAPEKSDDDLTDEETQIIQATQFHQWQDKKQSQVNQPQENGIIESVTCMNFMCHDFLEISIGPLVNFIIGHNGSGKSAVLTALTICLGGKASATNRAGSLKAFVKAGKESSTVSVKIKNKGETAFQQGVYGDTIVVERSFSISGASSFKLKSSSGRLISNKRGDLDEITDFYALQLDNPVSVLTQDNARQFLNASTPSDKYKFFMKGVQLEQLNQDYELLQESIQQIENTFDEKEANLKILSEKRDRSKANWEALEKASNIRHEIELLRVKMAWCQVEEQERSLLQHQAELKNKESELENAHLEVQRTTAGLDEAQARHNEIDEQKAQLNSELENAQQEKKVTEESQGSTRDETQTAARDVREIGGKIKSATARVKKAEESITTEEQRLADLNGGNFSQRLKDLERLRAIVEEKSNAYTEHVNGLPRLEETHQNAIRLIDQHKQTKDGVDADLRECDGRIRQLRQQGNSRNGFPPNMDRLLQAIAQSTEFQDKPVGPIGSYVQLKDPVWSSILERSFGGTLNGFIVTSKSDQNKLQTLLERFRCNGKCPIFIGNRGVIDTSQHEPESRFNTTSRVLDISNDLVRRQLIINQGIEQTILIEDQDEATREMSQERLRNVKQCFSTHPTLRGNGIRYSYGQGTNLKSDPVHAYKDPPRMKTQIEDQISFEENSRQRLSRLSTDAEKKHRGLQKGADECKKNINQHKKIGESLKIDMQRAEEEVERMQIVIDNESVEEGRLDTLRANLETSKLEKENFESQYQDGVLERDRMHAKLRDVQAHLHAQDSSIAVITAKEKSITQSLARSAEERHAALRQKNAAHEAETTLRDAHSRLLVSIGTTERTIAVFSMKCQEVGARVPIPEDETHGVLEAKLNRLSADITATEARVGDRPEVIREVQVASKKYEQALAQFNNEKKLADLLKQSLATRRERWGYFRKKIVARARCTFLHVLSERSFNGKLKVDHATRRLEIEIQPDETERSKGNRETTTLSGGEKSYSTICLLISLWDAVGAPIRCLDEFDVFMDSVNRDASMKLITKWARRSVGRQFILISPQAGLFQSASDVKIIRMSDPVRNNARLDVQRS